MFLLVLATCSYKLMMQIFIKSLDNLILYMNTWYCIWKIWILTWGFWLILQWPLHPLALPQAPWQLCFGFSDVLSNNIESTLTQFRLCGIHRPQQQWHLRPPDSTFRQISLRCWPCLWLYLVVGQSHNHLFVWYEM